MKVEELREGQLVLLNIDNGGMMVYARFIPPAAFETFTRFGTVANRLTDLDPKRVEILSMEQFMPVGADSLYGERVYSTQNGLLFLKEMTEDYIKLRERISRAYRERTIASVLAVKQALMFGMNAGRGLDDHIDWDDEWRNVLYVDLPDGSQISWHVSPDNLDLLEGLPKYEGEWDGTFESRLGHAVRNMDWRTPKWTFKSVMQKFVAFVKQKVGQ